MIIFLEKKPYHWRWLIFGRFFVVFILAILGMLAAGTELIDILNAYFNIDLDPRLALVLVAVGYLLLLFVATFGLILQDNISSIKWTKDELKSWGLLGIVIVCPTLLILFRALEIFYPLPIQYNPGELDRAKLFVFGITWVVIVVEALWTAYYDLKKQLDKYLDQIDD